MFTNNDYLSIAGIIGSTDWDESCLVEKDGFRISQFQGTIFPSDYQCFKVECSRNVIVAKFTGYSEYSALGLFQKGGFPVPAPIGYLVNKTDPQKILLFEEFMPGNELSSESPVEIWQKAAVLLAGLHLKYWNSRNDADTQLLQYGSQLYEEKWRSIVRCHYFCQKWGRVIQKILLRFSKAPKVIGHGDAFPTNFLVHDGQISFVDLSNSGVIPYMADIARLTCLPGPEEDTFLCPCREAVLNAYYKEIRQRLRLTKQEFLFDVKLAAFIELAANYIPPVGLNAYSLCYKSRENRRLERMLCSLADELA